MTKVRIIILFIISILQFSISTQAQYQYNPLVKDSLTWFMRMSFFINQTTLTSWDYELRISEYDTIINDKACRRFLRKYHIVYDNPPPLAQSWTSDVEEHYYQSLCLYEEDKKIYNGSYGLLYDFSVEVGDEVNPISWYTSNPGIVTKIDTVLIEGILRKKYDVEVEFNSNGDTLKYFIIEGIGSSIGLDNYGPYLHPSNELICVRNSYTNDLVYLSPNYETCPQLQDPISSIKTERNEFFKIQPNPFIDKIKIRQKSSIVLPVKVCITNQIGKIVFIKELENLDTEIDLHHLKEGIYFISIIGKSNQRITKKLIKAN